MDVNDARGWYFDFSAGIAQRGDDVIAFTRESGVGVAVRFIDPAPMSLDDQCRVAGEAIAAVIRALRPIS